MDNLKNLMDILSPDNSLNADDRDDILNSFGLATNRLIKPQVMTRYEFLKDELYNYNYTELIIGKNGELYKIKPAHIYTLMYLAGFKTQDEAYNEIPIDEDIIEYLVDKTSCISVWYKFCIKPKKITDAQLDTIKFLYEHGRVTYKE